MSVASVDARKADRSVSVIRWARRWDGEFTTADLMEAHRVTRDNAHQILSRLVVAGVVARVAVGIYRAVE